MRVTKELGWLHKRNFLTILVMNIYIKFVVLSLIKLNLREAWKLRSRVQLHLKLLLEMGMRS